jgi:hypothetical protein
MTNLLKMGLLTLGVGMAVFAGNANADIDTTVFISNPVGLCQAFTPGVSNTIRNRVVGSENVGTKSIAVACNMQTALDQNANNPVDNQIVETAVYFSNGSDAEVTFSCTLLAPAETGDAYASTKELTIAAGDSGMTYWTGADNPTPSPTLNNVGIGFNCNLPPHVTMSTILTWQYFENGIGT